MPKPARPLTNAICPRFRGHLTGPLVVQLVLAMLSLLALSGLGAWLLTPLLAHWLMTSP
jgi:multidrug efflux pump subunit AcrB